MIEYIRNENTDFSRNFTEEEDKIQYFLKRFFHKNILRLICFFFKLVKKHDAERVTMTVLESILIEDRNGYLWIILPGMIKRENVVQIQNRIEEAAEYKSKYIALDFKNISNIYSITINLIMRLREFVLTYNGDICIVNISDKCYRQMQLMQLTKVLTMYRSEKDIPSRAKS